MVSLTSPRGRALEKLEGNTGTMASWVRAFDDAAEALETTRLDAQRATELPGLGDGITRARADASELLDLVRPGILQAELLSRVLSTYSDAYSASAVPANRMIDEIEEAHAAWSRAAAAAENAGLNALWTARSGTEAEAERAGDDARDAIDARDLAQEKLDGLWRTWDQLYTDWDAAYDAALSALSNGTGAALTRDERDLLDALLAADDAAAVKKLWDAADPAQRDALKKARSDVVGNLDGIPYDVRAAVNEARLKELHSRLDSLPEPLKSDVAALWQETKSHAGRLISFDPDGSEQTTAALWYGPLNADRVSVLVPGMMSEVSGMGEWGQSARDLNSGVGAGTATVAWFGYDSPNFAEEPSQDRAKDGAPAFRSFLLGLNQALPDAEKTVVAHSYGSTMSARAIGSRADGLGVDRFITVGSAGLPTDRSILDNLQSSGAPRIYATQSGDDFWAPVGKIFGSHGTNPMDLKGTTVFDSDGATQTAEGEKVDLKATPGHSAHGGANFPWQHESGGYLQKGSESFYNVQQIIATGEPGTEPDGPGSQPSVAEMILEGMASPGMYGW